MQSTNKCTEHRFVQIGHLLFLNVENSPPTSNTNFLKTHEAGKERQETQVDGVKHLLGWMFVTYLHKSSNPAPWDDTPPPVSSFMQHRDWLEVKSWPWGCRRGRENPWWRIWLKKRWKEEEEGGFHSRRKNTIGGRAFSALGDLTGSRVVLFLVLKKYRRGTRVR